MMTESNFGRKWEFRFYGQGGLVAAEFYPEGVDGRLDNEAAWRAVELFQAERSISITRMERKSFAGQWEDVPVLR